MSTFDILGGLAILFGILNFLFSGFGFRSRFLTSKDSKITESGTKLTRITGGALVITGIILLII